MYSKSFMGKHDALNYLPSTRILDFPKRCAIYEPTRQTARLYLVLSGRVKIYCTAESGAETLLRMAGAEEFFGEATLVPADSCVRETAMTMEPTQVMSW